MFFWVVDNGEGWIWKFEVYVDGLVEKVDGWNVGKCVCF